jgi:hypothetical protein
VAIGADDDLCRIGTQHRDRSGCQGVSVHADQSLVSASYSMSPTAGKDQGADVPTASLGCSACTNPVPGHDAVLPRGARIVRLSPTLLLTC